MYRYYAYCDDMHNIKRNTMSNHKHMKPSNSLDDVPLSEDSCITLCLECERAFCTPDICCWCCGSDCCDRLKRKLIDLFYFVLIMFPWIIEIIVVSTGTTNDQKIMTVCICGFLQTMIATGGYLLGFSKSQYSNITDQTRRTNFCDDVWCSWCINSVSCKPLFSAGFIIYLLLPWCLTNIIISWILASMISLPPYAHVAAYMPIIIYIFSILLGYSNPYHNEYTYLAADGSSQTVKTSPV